MAFLCENFAAGAHGLQFAGQSIAALAGHMGQAENTADAPAQKNYLPVDGGMADNPRCALYGARYTAYAVTAPLAAEGVTDTATDTALAACGLARGTLPAAAAKAAMCSPPAPCCPPT